MYFSCHFVFLELIQIQELAGAPTTLSLLVLILNIGIMAVPIIILCVLTDNYIISLLVGIVLYFIWSIANYFVMLYRGSPLFFSELRNINTAFDVIQGYTLKLDLYICIGSGIRLLFSLLLLYLLNILRKVDYKNKKNTRTFGAILLILDVGFIVGGTYGDGIIKPRSTIGWSWSAAMSSYGFFSCAYEDIQNIVDPYIKPEEYNSEIFKVSKIDSTQENDQEYPDIILILNETFCDLSVYTDVLADQDYLSNFYNKSNAIYGQAVVSEIGKTNNSEYELLTSNSMYLLRSNSPFNYVNVSGHNIVQYLKEFNYTTWGMHCGTATNYSRNKAYPELGFDTILLGEDSFRKGTYGNRPWLDTDNYQDLIEEYEAGGANPRFMYMLTLQNHGSFEQNDSALDSVHTMNDYGDLTDDVNEYMTSISLSAEAFTDLTDYFSEVDRDVIICMVGDHAPSFISELPNSYDLSEDEQQIAMRTVPYIIWSNFSMECSDYTEYTSITDLIPMVLNLAGIPLDTYYQEIIELHNQVPIRTSRGMYVDIWGNIELYNEESQYYDEITKYYCMEYEFLINH